MKNKILVCFGLFFFLLYTPQPQKVDGELSSGGQANSVDTQGCECDNNRYSY